jgi:hypothetical protein
MAKKLSAAQLHRKRVESVESEALSLISYVEETYNNHNDKHWRRRHLLEKARTYAAAVNRLGGRR